MGLMACMKLACLYSMINSPSNSVVSFEGSGFPDESNPGAVNPVGRIPVVLIALTTRPAPMFLLRFATTSGETPGWGRCWLVVLVGAFVYCYLWFFH